MFSRDWPVNNKIQQVRHSFPIASTTLETTPICRITRKKKSGLVNTSIYNIFAEIQLQISNINERNELSISQQLYQGNFTFDMALDQPVAAADWLTRPSVPIDQLICRLQQKGLDYLYLFLQANWLYHT